MRQEPSAADELIDNSGTSWRWQFKALAIIYLLLFVVYLVLRHYF
jgi:hypothetical protein